MTAPAAGWYPDPAGGDGQRWWNGASWSDQVQPAPQATPQPIPQAEQTAAAAQPWGAGPQAPQWGAQQPGQPWAGGPQQPAAPTDFVQQNKFSLITAAAVLVVAVIAATTDYIVFALVPIFIAVQAAQRKEPLAWPAVGIAAALLIWRFTLA